MKSGQIPGLYSNFALRLRTSEFWDVRESLKRGDETKRGDKTHGLPLIAGVVGFLRANLARRGIVPITGIPLKKPPFIRTPPIRDREI